MVAMGTQGAPAQLTQVELGQTPTCMRSPCRYQSATMGTFQTAELIETFVNYHENIKKCVCIIYDPQRSARGTLALRAIRLKDSFIELYKQDKVAAKDLREANISWKDVFVDIPIKVRPTACSTLLRGWLLAGWGVAVAR